jgi:PIN domain nuclease of toxin-antitoxin system
VIDSNSLEQDAGEKPASAFSHPALSRTISDLINAQKEPVGFSIAQFWEVEIKMAAGRLQALDDLSEIVRNLNLELVSIEPALPSAPRICRAIMAIHSTAC